MLVSDEQALNVSCEDVRSFVAIGCKHHTTQKTHDARHGFCVFAWFLHYPASPGLGIRNPDIASRCTLNPDIRIFGETFLRGLKRCGDEGMSRLDDPGNIT